jgi:integrase
LAVDASRVAEIPAPALSLVPVQERQDYADFLVGELGLAHSTAFTYERNLRRYERYTGTSVREVAVSSVRRFLRHSEYHPSTKNSTLVAIRSHVRFRLLEDDIEPGLAAKILAIDGPKVPRRTRDSLTPAEVRRVLAACMSPNEVRVIYLGLYQGLRVSDSALLRAEHFRGDRLVFRSVKGDKPLVLPLHPEVIEKQEVILSSSPKSRDVLKHVCRSLSHCVGLPFSTHTLRRTFSTRLDDLEIQEGVIIELMGQEQVSVFRKHYTPVRFPRMARDLPKLFY